MHEAEAYCALMAVRGEVAAVLTNDTDAVAYGAPLVGCNYGTDAEFAADFAEALRATRLTHAAFLDACLLCGSDANNRIPGVGPQTAFRLMQKHGSAEAALVWAATSHPTGRHSSKLRTLRAREIVQEQLPLARRAFTTFCGDASFLHNGGEAQRRTVRIGTR